MKFPSALLALASVLPLTACQTGTSRVTLEQELADSRALVSRYEARYGKLNSIRPTRDFRKLRAQLKGQSMSAVTTALGKPAGVFSS